MRETDIGSQKQSMIVLNTGNLEAKEQYKKNRNTRKSREGATRARWQRHAGIGGIHSTDSVHKQTSCCRSSPGTTLITLLLRTLDVHRATLPAEALLHVLRLELAMLEVSVSPSLGLYVQ